MADGSLIERPPADLLAGDDALLASPPRAGRAVVRWYRATCAAVVLGFAQRRRSAQLVDRLRADTRGVALLERRAGGGAVLVDEHMLCLTVALGLPHPWVGDDLTESYRWLGDRFVGALRGLGVAGARRVETAEARADVATLRSRADSVADLLRASCYGAVSPHEVVCDGRKLVGFAQVRRRDVALYQAGLLLRDQAPLADLLRIPDSAIREAYRHELAARTVGLADLLASVPDATTLARRLAAPLVSQLTSAGNDETR